MRQVGLEIALSSVKYERHTDRSQSPGLWSEMVTERRHAMTKSGSTAKAGTKKLAVKKGSVKDLDVKAGKAKNVKGGATVGCADTFKSTGKNKC